MGLYRALISLLAPILVAALLWRVLRGGETAGDMAERLGRGLGRPGAIWIHGASNGELTAAKSLIAALAADHPDRPLLVTANTVTGRALVRGWDHPRVTARLAPLDLRWALAALRRVWRPAAEITLENELWPNRFATARAPLFCVSARISKRSAGRWARVPGLAGAMLGRIALLAPQDAQSGARFRALGLPQSALGPVYAPKQSVVLDPPDPEEHARLMAQFDRNETWLAASIHEGEEEALFEAYGKGPPNHRLILAPRHPRRGDAIRKVAAARGLGLAQRSRGEAPGPGIYLADTLGEMALWYSLAGVTFVGGSFVPKGGHTPYEPIQFGSAVIHGPFVENFQDDYAALHAAGGAALVKEAEALSDAVCRLLEPAEGARAAQSARQVAAARAASGAAEDTIRKALSDGIRATDF